MNNVRWVSRESEATKSHKTYCIVLTELKIENFKAWRDTGEIRMAPLTILFGANSAGKSSIGHLLLALKQTALSSDRKQALHLGDEASLIDLGTFSDCVHGHDLRSTMAFSMAWELPTPLLFRNPLIRSEIYGGENLLLRTELQSDRHEQPKVKNLEYLLYDIDPMDANIYVRHGYDEKNKLELEASPLSLVKAQGRVWPLEAPEKFYRFSEITLARFQNADFLTAFALETEKMLRNLYYLGPLRLPPKRFYQWSGDSPDYVGSQGEFAVAALLAANAEGRKLNRGPKKQYMLFGEFIAYWLQQMKMISSFKVVPVAKGRKEFEVLVRTYAGAPEVKLTDVGFGVSQVLPALVQAFYAPPGSTVWMEQPEIHLHPQVQAELADAFISATQAAEGGRPRNVQLIIESHSEHFLARLQRRVAEGILSPDDVAIYFCSRAGSKAEIEPLRINEFGEIENWPEHFFGDEMQDVMARTIAAMNKKIELGKGPN
ncbi:DUF3696 domain-containing protein [Ralstonia mannitolilytica]|uniref:DUF3696 domain-containing protein n=1 Tax=Ralstonia mannitolilytica TaxID=105219 RepID=UPI001F30E7B4|nr:DUF3696 domain-containing protein [Ralstonia mannitolilytica]